MGKPKQKPKSTPKPRPKTKVKVKANAKLKPKPEPQQEQKPKLALYWAASCGGCEVTVVDLNEKILDVAAAFDIVFWPCAMDFKYSDVEAMPDKSIDVCLFNGAIRTSEQEYLANLLRRKSKVLVAFGSCAHEGCIPGLANVTNRDEIFESSYKETPTTTNPENVMPQTSCKMPEGELHLPEFFDTVKTLGQTVEVDYTVPGCPPVAERVWDVIEVIMKGELPPAGSIVGANEKTVCDECELEKEEKKITKFYRPHEIKPDPKKCLLEQGIICSGPATRGGCGHPCTKALMPCRGCYGPPPGVIDQGAKLLSAVCSVIDSEDPDEIARIVDEIVDPIGTFYRFGLPLSLLGRVKIK